MSNDQQQPESKEPVMSHEDLTHDSMKMVCPSCNLPIHTKVSYKITPQTHLMAFVVTLFAFCGGCFCFMPYCLGAWKDAKHKCPLCGKFIGIHNGMDV